MDVRLDGRKAFVTGGSRGLGRAMALKFAESGADVTILARRETELEETRAEIAAATGRNIYCQVGDAGRAEDIQRAFDGAVADMGQVDILVNNAGSSVAGPFENHSDEVWQSDFDLKIFATIRTMRLALPGMKERRWGRIINVLNTGPKLRRQVVHRRRYPARRDWHSPKSSPGRWLPLTSWSTRC